MILFYFVIYKLSNHEYSIFLPFEEGGGMQKQILIIDNIELS